MAVMIGRLRAAWDDSRRTAHHRRGTNPMSRTEWLDVVDKINSLPTPDSPLDRYLAGINAQEEKSDAEYQAFLRLRRPSADRADTDATPNIVEDGKRYGEAMANALLGVFGLDPTVREVGSLLGFVPGLESVEAPSDEGCSAQVVLASHVIDVTLEQNPLFGTLKVTVHLPEGPVWRTIVHPSLGNGDGHQVLPTHDFPVDEGLGGQGESEGSTSVGTFEGAGGLLGHTSAHASAASLEERVSGSGVVHESEHGEGAAGCGHRGADGGEREEAHRVRPQCQGNDDVPVTVGPDVELVGIGNENGLEFGRGGDGPFGHSASPSIDGGHRTVGEGEVAGVETAAPVTDATDVFAGPGLFRYDGTQAHRADHAAADEAAARQDLTRQIGDYLAELHRQGESWHQMARLILHVFELRQRP